MVTVLISSYFMGRPMSFGQSNFLGALMNYEMLANIAATEAASDSSWIVIADVRGSTEAVRQGRYRDVNLIGAACVASIRNSFEQRSVPYVFGGDGATFLVAQQDLERCEALLTAVQTMAWESFQLNLGIGRMQVSEIRRMGADIRFGFLTWGESELLPFFRGNGLPIAEKKIKESMTHLKQAPAVNAPAPSIEGLSCQLMPFKAVRGRILSVLVEPMVTLDREDAILAEVFAVFKRRGRIERLSPVSKKSVRRPWLTLQWVKEAYLHRRSTRFLDTLKALITSALRCLILTSIFRFDWKTKVIGNVKVYQESMLTQSDWMKMDGVLRMVIDVTPEEEAELRQTLDRLEAAGLIVFGIFASSAALMTCHFQSIEGQRHAHFIDGAEGGLTLAAMDMKKRKTLKKPLQSPARAS